MDLQLPVIFIKKLILQHTLNVPFLFDSKPYLKQDGVAMASPVEPLLIDIFVANLEQTHLEQPIKQLNGYQRYFDDNFACHKTRKIRV